MPAARLHVFVPGQQGCGKGHNDIEMGQGDIPVPTSGDAAEGPVESEDVGYHCDLDSPSLALSHVVDLGHLLDGGATLQAASLLFDIDEEKMQCFLDPLVALVISGSTFRTL